MPKDVGSYLAEQQKKSTGEIATEWGLLEELYNKKLWHQVTLRLLNFVKNPIFMKGDALIRMYENFISDFEHRINPLALVEIIIFVVRQISDPKQAIDFLEKIKEKAKSNDEAKLLCMITIALIKLKNRDVDNVKTILEECRTLLDSFDGVTSVHSRFYELSSNYHKLQGNHAEYYKEALRFLGCTDVTTIPSGEQVERAFNLGLAAVLGEGVYNFGELLAHPILESLKTTDKEWLVHLLYAFNSGNITKFDELKKQWATQPDLAQSEIKMRQKISLLCLMEAPLKAPVEGLSKYLFAIDAATSDNYRTLRQICLVNISALKMTFKRPATNRQLTFQEIATEARLPENEVELLVMKALSLGLVRGSLDEVDRKVHLTWVQPRVLDLDQISTMQKRLEQWCEDVVQMERLLEAKAQDILT